MYIHVYCRKIAEKEVEIFKMCCFFIMINLYIYIYIYINLKFLRTVSFKDEESESAFMFSVSTTSPSVSTVAGSEKKKNIYKNKIFLKTGHLKWYSVQKDLPFP